MSDTILDEAGRITSGDRNVDYGTPLDNHTCTAALWTAFLSRYFRRGFRAIKRKKLSAILESES